MKSRFLADSLFGAVLTEIVPQISSSGNELDVFEIHLNGAPTYNTGWVIIDFENQSKRDLVFFHNRIGTTLLYYRKDRDLLGTGAISQLHSVQASVKMNDNAGWINHALSNVDDFGQVISWGSSNKVKIYGGRILIGEIRYIIADAVLVVPSGTKEVVFNYNTRTFIVIETADLTALNGMWLGTVVSSGTQINSVSDIRSIIAPLKVSPTFFQIVDGILILKNQVVGTSEIADNSVTQVKMADNSVGNAEIINDSITTSKILNLNVTRAKIEADAIDSTKLADGAVGNEHIQTDSITTSKIADLNITRSKIADGAISTNQIDDGSITTVKIADLNVTTAKIVDLNVTTAKINTGAVEENKISNSAVTINKIAANSISTAKVQDGAITRIKLEADIIDSTKLADDSIGAEHIQANAVGSSEISAGSVTAVKIATDAVESSKILAGAITEAKIDNNSVSQSKMKAGSVGTAEIIDLNVTTAKIAEGGITTSKIASGAINETKIAADAVRNANILDGEITNSKIASGTIQASRIQNLTITGDKIAAGTITTDKLNSAITGLSLKVGLDGADTGGYLLNKLKQGSGAILQEVVEGGVRKIEVAFNSGTLLTYTGSQGINMVGTDARLGKTMGVAGTAGEILDSREIKSNGNTILLSGDNAKFASGYDSSDTIHSSLQGKSIASNIREVGADTTLDHNDHTIVITADNITITLPASASVIGRSYVFVRKNATHTTLSIKTTDGALLFGYGKQNTNVTVASLNRTYACGDYPFAFSLQPTNGFWYVTDGGVSDAYTTTELDALLATKASKSLYDAYVLANDAAVNLKAPKASPTFTGTVAGITKTMVGLGSVDNTTDADKPISTAQATAINAKEASANKVTTMSGYTTNNVVFLSAKAVYDRAIGLFAPLISPALTGTPTAPTAAPGINTTQIATTAFVNSGVTVLNAPQGFMINGKIVTSVASNNLTVAIKTLAGNNPSASDPVYVRIGDTVRTISNSISAGAGSGVNRLNSGSSELAAQEIDYFCYLQRNTTTSAVNLLVSRLPYLRTMGDALNSGTSEKGIFGINNYNSTNEIENIGRFNVTLSLGLNWSIPATSIIINRPVFETRLLKWNPVRYQPGSMTVVNASSASIKFEYQIIGNKCSIRGSEIITTGGTTTYQIERDLPMGPYKNTSQDNGYYGSGYISNAYAGLCFINSNASYTTNRVNLRINSAVNGGNYDLGTQWVRYSNEYPIG